MRFALTCLLFLVTVSLSSARPLAPFERIEISCGEDPALNLERVLSSQGTVPIPGVGEVGLGGMEPIRAAVAVQEALEDLDPSTIRTIRVRRIYDPGTPVRFRGLVKSALSVRIGRGTRLSDLLSLAEPLPDADIEAVEIVGVDDVRLLANFRSGQDPLLRAGDLVSLNRSSKPVDVFVLGAVSKPGAYPWKAGMTVAQAVDLAGGVTTSGDGNALTITREEKLVPLTPGLRLERGDVVLVGLRPERRFVTVQGAVARPGLIEFRDGLTLTQAIDLAGGLSRKARSTVVTLTPKSGPKRRFDLGAIRSGKTPDVELRAFDVLEVSLFVHPASGDSQSGG